MDDPNDVYVVDERGRRGKVPRSELATWQEAGYHEEKPEETEEAYLKQEYGDQAGQSFLMGAAKVPTFGLSSVLLNALDPEGTKNIPKYSPRANLAGEITTGVAAAGVGAQGLLTRGAKALGEAAVEQGASKLAGRALTVGAEGMGYGAGQAVHELATQEGPITAEGALTTVGSNLLMGGAAGIAGEAVISGASKVLGKAGQGIAKKLSGQRAEAAMEAAEGKTAQQAADAVQGHADYPEIATMGEEETRKATVKAAADRKAQRAKDIVEGTAEKEAEEAFLKETRDAKAQEVHKELRTYVDTELKPARNIEVQNNRELSKKLGLDKGDVMIAVGTPTAFVKDRGARVINALEKAEEGYKRAMVDAEEVMANASARQQSLIDGLPKPKNEYVPMAPPERPAGLEPGSRAERKWQKSVDKVEIANAKAAAEHAKLRLTTQQSKMYSEWSGIPIPEGQKVHVLLPDEMAGFTRAIQEGEVLHPDIRRIQDAQARLERNQAMQARVRELQEPLGSQKLTDIENRIATAKADVSPSPYEDQLRLHQEDLQASRKSLGRSIAQGIGGIAGGSLGGTLMGPVGSIGGAFLGRDLMNKAFDRFVTGIRKANGARQVQIGKAIGQIFEKGGQAASKNIPRATAIMATTSYAPKDHADAVMGPSRYAPSKDPNVEAFRQRKRELDSVTQKNGPGQFSMRPFSMKALGERMAAIWEIAPTMANAMEKAQQNKLSYLAEKCPRDPTPPHLQVGPSTWEPNKAEIAKFARIMQVSENPLPAVQRLADGTATPDDIETLQRVWPAHYDQIKKQCMDHMGQLQRTMPYQKRLSLSILFDIPVDPALTQETLGVFQRKVAGKEAGGASTPPTQNKPLPTGMIQPTNAQRMAAK